jgi:GT2 family glycosyltransferase
VFVDADVTVHPDALRRFADSIAREPGLVAIFGAYDEQPPAPGFLSRYRNLLHRYTHLLSSGEADTFWAGCGAVERRAFQAAGGFDAARYPRPQIEDIELGYRLRDRGGRVLLNPEIQGAHLKRWTLIGSVRTDLFDRGIPWVRLLLERRNLARTAKLNLKAGERAKTALVALGLLLLLGGAVLGSGIALAAGGLALLAVVLWNLPLLRWFARQRGPLFALAVIPMNLWYYVVSGLAVIAGVTLALGSRTAAGTTGGNPSA